MAGSALLSWAAKQPDWVQDALRRHAVASGALLDAAAKTAILDRVEHHSGKRFDVAPACTPISEKDLGSAASSKNRTALCSIGPVKHLNRLAADQQLNFALNGITLIYGDNGSGKSGYARIAKRVCRSLSKDELLGNVFNIVEEPPAEVQIRFKPDGSDAVKAVDWKVGDEPPTEIADISVFDSQNATLYVNRENRIGFLPAEISLLQRHAEHREEMSEAFDKEIKSISAGLKVPLNAGYTPGGKVAVALAGLEIKAKVLPKAADLKSLGTWTPEDDAELEKLSKELAADPVILAAQRRRIKASLKSLSDTLPPLKAGLSTEAVDAYKACFVRQQVTAEAASLAAEVAFSGLPLKGVGQSPWQLMYDHARQYAESIGLAAGKLPDNIGDPCVTCHTPLSAEAAARIKSFNDFVANQAAKDADAARRACEVAYNSFQDLQVATKTQVDTALAEYAGTGAKEKANADKVAAYFQAAAQRRADILKAKTIEDIAGVSALPADPTELLSTAMETLEAEANAFDLAATKDEARKSQRAKYNELTDRKRLSENLPAVLDRLEKLERCHHLKRCQAAVATADVSRQITAMRRSSVMAGLGKRIMAELKGFGLDHIPFEVNDSSQTGQSFYAVNLTGVSNVSKSKILSEGEQRALALACFLGEVGEDDARNGLIIDDPVSSLDHTRLRAVAARLVAEAKSRQVIIFTHNILFFNEVREAAAKTSPAIPVLSNYFSKSAQAGFGLISQTDEPWQMAKVATRIHVLRNRLGSYKAVTDFDTDDWRAKAKDFYTDLRETWERLVEELVLGKVVERFRGEVQTQSLKSVVVTDDDYKTIFWAMKRASERSGHDLAAGKSIAPCTWAEMKSDLEAIETYSSALKIRSNQAEAERKKLEKPPVAEVA